MSQNLEQKNFKARLRNLIGQRSDFAAQYTESLTKADGRAHISIDLRHGNLIFETYSSGKDLCYDIYDYVEGVAKYTRVSVPLTVEFILAEHSAPIEKQIQEEFIGNYRFEFDDKRNEMKKSQAEAVFLMLIGVVFLAIYSAILIATDNTVWSVFGEIFSIVSWVFIWASIDKWVFERAQIRKACLRAAQLADSQIVFLSDEEASSYEGSAKQ
jgi:hypothetical protein